MSWRTEQAEKYPNRSHGVMRAPGAIGGKSHVEVIGPDWRSQYCPEALEIWANPESWAEINRLKAVEDAEAQELDRLARLWGPVRARFNEVAAEYHVARERGTDPGPDLTAEYHRLTAENRSLHAEHEAQAEIHHAAKMATEKARQVVQRRMVAANLRADAIETRAREEAREQARRRAQEERALAATSPIRRAVATASRRFARR